VEAPIAEEHCGLADVAQRVNQQPEEGVLPRVLRPWDLRLVEDGHLDRDRPAAHHDGGHQHAQGVMPPGPVDGNQQTSACSQHPEQWRGERVVADPGIAPEPLEPIEGTPQLNAELDGQMARHGQRRCLSHFG